MTLTKLGLHNTATSITATAEFHISTAALGGGKKGSQQRRSSSSLCLPPLITEHLLERNGITEEQELKEAWGNCREHSHLHHVIKNKR